MTPEQAEAEAALQGFGPIATKPNRIQFDPQKMPWWSLPMALAWIAWRTAERVQESCAEYRENWLEWFPGSWNVPTEDSQRFERIDGFELKSVRASTTVRLAFVESYMRTTETLPSSTQMTLADAEKELFRALAAGTLGAIARDKQGNIVDIPQREWPYLQLFEEGEQDVLKHDPLDRSPAFTEIKLKRDDIQRLWVELIIEPQMIEPMTRPGTAGYVPLCSALHWIMTRGGGVVKHLNDDDAWMASTERLLPLISTGEVEIIGRPRSGGPAEPIKGHVFAGILVPAPLTVSFSIINNDDPWISCTIYTDEPHWTADFNDQAFLDGLAGPSWTHLRVRKADVLRHIVFEQRMAEGRTIYETGAPGRPTSMQLIRAEFKSRHLSGLTAPSITKEAEVLSKWLSKAHPGAPQVKPKTIKNGLAEDYRKLRARK